VRVCIVMNVCVPTFESSGRSCSAVTGRGCSGRPHHSRSRRVAGQRKQLSVSQRIKRSFLNVCALIESDSIE